MPGTTAGYQFEPENRETPHSLKAQHLKTIAKNQLPGKVAESMRGAKKQVSRIERFELLDRFIQNDFQNRKLGGFQPDEEDIDIRAKAIRTLTKLLDNPRDDIRLGAARSILEFKL